MHANSHSRFGESDSPASCTRIERSDAATGRRSLSWWFVPDLSLILLLFTLMYCLGMYDGTVELLRDSDAGWHIRNGETILEAGILPRTDPYSLLHSGAPWFAWEWGSDVLMGWLHRRGGLAAVTGFFALALGLVFWLWMRLNRAAGGHFLIAGALAPVAMMTTQIHWHARPHVLSWILLLAALHYAERPGRRLSLVFIGSIIWANVHASFFFGPLIAAIYAAAYFLRPLIWTDIERDNCWMESQWFAKAAVISAAATLVNPYGWEVHRHVFTYLTNTQLLANVGEFQAFNFFGSGAWPMLIALGVSAIGAILAVARRRLEHALFLALLLFVAVRSARGLPVLALLALPLANGAITQCLRSATNLNIALRRRLDGFLEYGGNLWKLDRRCCGVIPAIVAAVIVFFWLRHPAVASRSGFPEREFPVKAAATLDTLPRPIRLLAPDVYGGYLIYRFNGAVKVYFDGRSDFYGVDAMKQYLTLMQLRTGWQSELQKIGFDYALLPNGALLVPALEGLGWKRMYADNVAIILKAPRNTTRNR